ncbi:MULTISPECIES: Rha family transcriptional regulator [Paenibacillus]|uniref:Rha family transcriptional regulator n=1 Tax=Paenibacillus TaxID=44249 RepID=UPI002115EA41|nr:Rha family transcriptional regulator [Paenibacillus odorifer]
MMTKDGFTFLVFGYRGKKASRFKEAYIHRFNQMEFFITSLLTAKMEHPAFTAAIVDAHEEPKHYHFSNEADMINRIVLGMSAKQFREVNGIAKGESVRPYLSSYQIKAVEELQRIDIGLLLAIPEYEDRKQALTKYYERQKLKKIA